MKAGKEKEWKKQRNKEKKESNKRKKERNKFLNVDEKKDYSKAANQNRIMKHSKRRA